MNLSEYIKGQLKKQGRSQKWLADQLLIDEKTFTGKLLRDSLTAQELLRIAYLMELDLNEIQQNEIVGMNNDEIKNELLSKLKKNVADKFKRRDLYEIQLVASLIEWKNACPDLEFNVDMYGKKVSIYDIESVINEKPNILASKIINYITGEAQETRYYRFFDGVMSEDGYIQSYLKHCHTSWETDDVIIERAKRMPHYFSSIGCIMFGEAELKN